MAFCLAALTLPAQANPAQDARKAIQAAYIGMDQATGRRNAAAYSAYLTPDFVGLDEKGANTGGKAKTLQALRQAFASVTTARSTTHIQTLTLQDGGAIVTTEVGVFLSGTKEGQPFVITGKDQARDFWIKPGGRWLLKRERVLAQTQSLNGRPVPQ